MVIIKKELKEYFKSIKKNLKFSFNVKRQIMKNLKSQVFQYIGDVENVNIDEIIREFGDYKTIVLNLKEEELNYYKRKARIMLFLQIVLFVIIVLLVIIIIFILDSLGIRTDIVIKK